MTNLLELQRQGNPNIVIAFAGNKADLASTNRRVRLEVFIYLFLLIYDFKLGCTKLQ
jgi:hypothetical protein